MASSRVRLDPAARREQLLDLGVELLATHPVDELSVELLAEQAGVSRGLLYHYFRSKQDFHRAVVRRATDQMLALTAPDPHLDPRARLHAGLAAYVDYVESHAEPFVSLVRGAAGGDRHLRAIYQDARSVLTGRIVHSLDELGVPDTAATRLLVEGWAAMVEESVIAWVREHQVDKADLVRLLADALPAVLSVSGRSSA